MSHLTLIPERAVILSLDEGSVDSLPTRDLLAKGELRLDQEEGGTFCNLLCQAIGRTQVELIQGSGIREAGPGDALPGGILYPVRCLQLEEGFWAYRQT